MTARITSEQEKQFRRFVEDASNRALKEINPDKEGLQRLIERGGEFQAYVYVGVVAGITRYSGKPDSKIGSKVLGKDDWCRNSGCLLAAAHSRSLKF